MSKICLLINDGNLLYIKLSRMFANLTICLQVARTYTLSLLHGVATLTLARVRGDVTGHQTLVVRARTHILCLAWWGTYGLHISHV